MQRWFNHTLSFLSCFVPDKIMIFCSHHVTRTRIMGFPRSIVRALKPSSSCDEISFRGMTTITIMICCTKRGFIVTANDQMACGVVYRNYSTVHVPLLIWSLSEKDDATTIILASLAHEVWTLLAKRRDGFPVTLCDEKRTKTPSHRVIQVVILKYYRNTVIYDHYIRSTGSASALPSSMSQFQRVVVHWRWNSFLKRIDTPPVLLKPQTHYPTCHGKATYVWPLVLIKIVDLSLLRMTISFVLFKHWSSRADIVKTLWLHATVAGYLLLLVVMEILLEFGARVCMSCGVTELDNVEQRNATKKKCDQTCMHIVIDRLWYYRIRIVSLVCQLDAFDVIPRFTSKTRV